MKTQLRTPARTSARYTEEALELWRLVVFQFVFFRNRRWRREGLGRDRFCRRNFLIVIMLCNCCADQCQDDQDHGALISLGQGKNSQIHDRELIVRQTVRIEWGRKVPLRGSPSSEANRNRIGRRPGLPASDRNSCGSGKDRHSARLLFG